MQRNTTRTKQQGAASIEFAFVFILIFAIFYGMVGYFVPLLLSATYQELSSEALRQSISLRYSSLDTNDIQLQAQRVIDESWLPETWAHTCEGYSNRYLKTDGNTWSVCVRHNSPASILMPISLFGLDLLRLPDEIRGEAAVRLH
ncbi:TadE family protein [Halopseudomonas bauzanensis]|uniref:TadE family protein n=1 Tax=Halopseudomonas bauzanensis TaxID=653930 RepID=UPI0035266BBA